ncbi:hypothetical protein HBDW_18970 [Herbaspirillum sp. DW155]|uniref:hypothetical protein n=1 Tax=Herbaspirillum sp. DW155 TaxID=3095609 RepID=UPI00308C2A39|nr:hypothetical protein HBDW_18970 [Herbaspirillum sp. DW155]
MIGAQSGADLARQDAMRAADHADRVCSEWTDQALAAFRKYATEHAMFATEDVSTASADVPPPPDKRAWGSVAIKACAAGVCEKAGMGVSKLPHAHHRPITIWMSKIYQGAIK